MISLHRLRRAGALAAAVAALVAASGCTTVQAWQKGNLAKKEMSFDPDPLESRYQLHIYFSKENATGGYGAGGGGCGCN